MSKLKPSKSSRPHSQLTDTEQFAVRSVNRQLRMIRTITKAVGDQWHDLLEFRKGAPLNLEGALKLIRPRRDAK